jgi:ABC-type bacteriocin/lantibiotic exporter with double-glycine peptidase domain
MSCPNSRSARSSKSRKRLNSSWYDPILFFLCVLIMVNCICLFFFGVVILFGFVYCCFLWILFSSVATWTQESCHQTAGQFWLHS